MRAPALAAVPLAAALALAAPAAEPDLRPAPPPSLHAGGDNRCERCGSQVVDKVIPEWASRIPAYADSLLGGLDRLTVARAHHHHAAQLEARAPATLPSRAEQADELAESKEALEQAPAQLAEGLLSTSFTAPRRESVDGAGRTRKVFLSGLTLQAELSRVTAPRADPSAYLAAKAVNGTGAPLLPGPDLAAPPNQPAKGLSLCQLSTITPTDS